MELKKEQLEQLKACTTVEELKAFAESLGGQITDEKAVELLKIMDEHRMPGAEGKLGDDALAEVDGGAWDWAEFGEGFALSAFLLGITCVTVAIEDIKQGYKKKYGNK